MTDTAQGDEIEGLGQKTPDEMLASLEAHLLVVHDALTTADASMTAQAAELASLRERLAKAEGEIERLTSDRQYIVGWNDGFAHVNGPLRFPTMLRKMWSGGEVQAWLDAQRIEAAREAAADEGSALARAEARALLAESKLAEAKRALAFSTQTLREVEPVLAAVQRMMNDTGNVPKGYAPGGPLNDAISTAIRQGAATLSNLETQETRHDR